MSTSAPSRWRVSEHGSSFLVGEDREGGRLIAELPTGCCHPAFKAQQRENAAMIASIPDLQARIAELERQAAIGRRAVEIVDQALPVWSADGIDPERHHCELTLLNERLRARAEIFSRLRDAEQANGQGILDSSAPAPATVAVRPLPRRLRIRPAPLPPRV